ncbi:hypothetical protein F1D05_14385 [Kribbella qitaiheensis]|uniref:Uncharacterized protein n=1 Tax=Kribbella qitaiheensis TaxID=1544730 RepID=A0A7G6WY14_9ACTN|nr:hypothetical protein [Kribbella qitaiheensis]QNE18879.1 hypothetical protein F1D05_14385 [Kribbella qitaiheensis]
MRARFEATLRAPNMDSLFTATIASCGDVPELVTKVERLASRYANLVAACRAGLVWAVENGDPTDRDTPWGFVADALPPAPAGHPLHTPSVEGGGVA